MLRACFALLLLGRLLLGAVSEDALPQAEWLTLGAPEETGQTAFFRKAFVAPPGVIKAVLLAACDDRMTVFLNGEAAAEIAGRERAASIDLSSRVRAGQNVLAIRVTSSRGPAAFRLMLELATDRGRQSWVVSDASWLSSPREAPGWTGAHFAATGWTPSQAHGKAGLERWGDVFHATKSVDAYNSWMLARGAAQASDPAAITAPAGFRVELLRSAQPDEGSWIALAFDPQGRLTVARENRGLLRMTLGRGIVENVELIEDTLLECRGLLYAHGALFVNANNSKGFYRLRDTAGDGRFDETTLLLRTEGGVGHGRNHVVLGPDGALYLVHGNDVVLPGGSSIESRVRHAAPDQLFPESWGEQCATTAPPHGHILRSTDAGQTWQVVASGLRNPLDVAFDEEGEMFTYEADNERDIGAPWYRPTRVLHLVPGADYGWRPGAGKFPFELPDTLPAAVDIGVGSPCGVEFGTHSNFPEKFRSALFISDWAYGRILAVHLDPLGASYRGDAEPFIAGRPLNVTDLTFGPDGAMYFVTGGRGTQSGLYRVSFSGGRAAESPAGHFENEAGLRALRRDLEAMHGASADAVETLWPRLAHTDRFIRRAARVALEDQPLDLWRERALTESDPATLLGAVLALVRCAPPADQPAILAKLGRVELGSLTPEQQLFAVRIYALSFARAGAPPDPLRGAIARRLGEIYPAKNWPLDRELCRVLVYLRAPDALPKTCALLANARAPEQLLHYIFHLRHLRDGWSLEQRRLVFDSIRRAERLQGARDYHGALRRSREELSAALTPLEREALANVISPEPIAPVIVPDFARFKFAKAWMLDDFTAEEIARKGSATAGRAAFAAAQCASCHRASGEPGAVIGPDLTSVTSRFNRRDLLEHILVPEKAIDEKYRQLIVTTRDGAQFEGAVEREDSETLFLSVGAAPDAIAIGKSHVSARENSSRSPMPSGLLNILSKDQIADLLTFLEAGGTAPLPDAAPAR